MIELIIFIWGFVAGYFYYKKYCKEYFVDGKVIDSINEAIKEHKEQKTKGE